VAGAAPSLWDCGYASKSNQSRLGHLPLAKPLRRKVKKREGEEESLTSFSSSLFSVSWRLCKRFPKIPSKNRPPVDTL
jgi:hypothetical protein